MDRVLCSATVEDLGNMTWMVEVTGVSPFDHRRTYTIKATSDDKAAMQGIDLFVEEMECFRDAALKEE